MANGSLEVPFNVKLTSKATAFHCMETRFSIHSTQVKTVKAMSDQIRQTILAGGLEVTDEKATPVLAAVAAPPKAAPEKPAAGTGKPPAANASKAKSAMVMAAAKKAAKAADAASDAGGGEAEPSVEDILEQE